MLKHVDVAVYTAIAEARSGIFVAGVKRFRFADKGVDYSVDEYNLKILLQSVGDRADQRKTEIISGRIVVPDHHKN